MHSDMHQKAKDQVYKQSNFSQVFEHQCFISQHLHDMLDIIGIDFFLNKNTGYYIAHINFHFE